MLAKIESKKEAIALMLKLLTKLLKKAPKQANSGFTLIELLVAMIIATLVITPLLGFMINILNSDRIEQAKATSEAEIQTAIDYIAQDLEQAVYIYDAIGIENASTDPAPGPGIRDQIPPSATAPRCGTSTPNCFPVLVFWKRELVKNILPFVGSTPETQDDTFVYSLVAYYLVKDPGGIWSNTARIARFQIRAGVIDPNNPVDPANPVNADGTPKYVYIKPASKGYKDFDLTNADSTSTLSDKMNLWTKTATPYTDEALTLIDYVDQNTADSPIQNCPADMPRVPSNTNIRGFYACVNSSKTLAQVYIRGNALARTSNTNSYSAGNSAYFPTASVQVKGRGSLGIN